MTPSPNQEREANSMYAIPSSDAIRQALALVELQRCIDAELAMLEALARFETSDDDPWDDPEWDEDVVALGPPRGVDECFTDPWDMFGGVLGEDTPLLSIDQRNDSFLRWLERTCGPLD